MQRKTGKLVLDALEACQSIEAHSSGITMEQYCQERWVRRAFERELEIVGEALSRLSKLDSEVANQIPELRQVVDFRNRIIHGYDAIDDEIVWKTIQTDVPPLSTRLAALLNSPDEGAK
jgi:uncharacterized protein with HEPN domain